MRNTNQMDLNVINLPKIMISHKTMPHKNTNEFLLYDNQTIS